MADINTYTYKTAAEYLGMREQYVRQLVRKGRITVVGSEGPHDRKLLSAESVHNYKNRGHRVGSIATRDTEHLYKIKLSPEVYKAVVAGSEPLNASQLALLRFALEDAIDVTELNAERQAERRTLMLARFEKERALNSGNTNLADLWDDEVGADEDVNEEDVTGILGDSE